MDPIKNPFSPGAGSPPPELAGRGAVLEQVRILLGRVKEKRPEKSLLLTGLRGVGKTVLLNQMEQMALQAGYRTILIEALENKPLAALLAPHLRTLLFSLNRLAGAGDKVRRSLAVLKSFLNGVKITVGDVELGLDIDPEIGAADSGDIESDLPNLLVAVAEAAEDRGVPVAILIDEVQYFGASELSALIMAMHKMQQRRLPMVLIGAGLPILPALAGDSKSYAERLFNFPVIGPLAEADACKALQEPVNQVGIEFEQQALAEIFRLTKGYPYFLQEWGYRAWNHAQTSPITLGTVVESSQQVIASLDENFFRVRYVRLTQGEKKFVRALAELGPGPYRTSEVTDRLQRSAQQIGPVRAGLIKKGMIYSPAFGEMAFTVPLFDEYLLRVMPAPLPNQ